MFSPAKRHSTIIARFNPCPPFPCKNLTRTDLRPEISPNGHIIDEFLPTSERRPENGDMLYSLLAQLCATLIDLFRIARLSSDDKDLEILILRKQLDILVRKQAHTVRPNRQEKWTPKVARLV